MTPAGLIRRATDLFAEIISRRGYLVIARTDAVKPGHMLAGLDFCNEYSNKIEGIISQPFRVTSQTDAEDWYEQWRLGRTLQKAVIPMPAPDIRQYLFYRIITD